MHFLDEREFSRSLCCAVVSGTRGQRDLLHQTPLQDTATSPFLQVAQCMLPVTARFTLDFN